jgi:hypothetical protein
MLKSNNRILLGSTSFLLSNNLNWDFLEKDKNITFSNYGDIYETLYNKNNFEITILIIFLADLINYINFDSYKKERQKKNILKILSLIDRRLNLNKSTLIVSISEYLFHNTIISSKNYNFTRKIYNFFLDELYKLSNKYNNFFILELDRIFYPYGFIRCFDYRNYYFDLKI